MGTPYSCAIALQRDRQVANQPDNRMRAGHGPGYPTVEHEVDPTGLPLQPRLFGVHGVGTYSHMKPTTQSRSS